MDFATFKRAWKTESVIHLTAEIPADLLTPASVFLRLGGGKAKASFLLESVEAGENIGRYSIIGVAPVEIVTFQRQGGALRTPTVVSHFAPSDFVRTLRSRLPENHKHSGMRALDGLTGGWVGYFGYDCAQLFERLPFRAKDTLGHPWAMLGLYDRIVLFDHARQTAQAVATIYDNRTTGGAKKVYDQARRELDSMLGRLTRSSPLPDLSPQKSQRAQSNMTRGGFRQSVGSFKRHIGRGDIFQGVLSQRFDVRGSIPPFDVYRRLRRTNPSPYMYFLKFGGMAIAGSSPETLVQKRGTMVVTRPIAGTRPRGSNPDEDLRKEKHLLASSKESAEHVMLVDLGRNDLGRVCLSGTVTTDQFRAIDRYSHVMHMVSTVSGTTKRGIDSFDVLAATFPAGTVTGAPKIRAMELIDEHEPDRRGVYAGCVGYIDWHDNMDMAIAIRTAVIDRTGATVQAGAGIVADSDPDREYLETCTKAAAPLAAVGGVVEVKPS